MGFTILIKWNGVTVGNVVLLENDRSQVRLSAKNSIHSLFFFNNRIIAERNFLHCPFVAIFALMHAYTWDLSNY